MGFKRPIMIAGGTVGAIAAVLSYQPAQSSTGLLTSSAPLGSATASNAQGAATASASTATQTPSAAPSSSSTTASATKKNKSTKSTKSLQSSTNSGAAANATAGNTQPSPQPSTSQSQAPTETTTPPPPAPAPAPAPAPTKTAGAPQTITGPVISTRWGPVQVEIVVDNGQIVSATGLQYPHGDRRSSYISQQAIPMLVDLTLQAQSASGMQGIGGATYTSNGWKSSLAAALRNI